MATRRTGARRGDGNGARGAARSRTRGGARGAARAGAIDTRALGAGLRAILEALPESTRAPVWALISPDGGGAAAASVRLDRVDVETALLGATELLDDEPEITRRVTGRSSWEKLVANVRHFVEDVLEGWENEGREFPSRDAKEAAIGALVRGTIARIRRDPKRWMREHCDR